MHRKFVIVAATLCAAVAVAAGGSIYVTNLPPPGGVTSANLDLNGVHKLVCDADGDSYVYANTDDTLDLYVTGEKHFSLAADALTLGDPGNAANYTLTFNGDSATTTIVHNHSTGVVTFSDDIAAGSVALTADLTSSDTGDIGWSLQAAGNQACNTTCTSACVFGYDDGGDTIVACDSADADKCICAGAS